MLIAEQERSRQSAREFAAARGVAAGTVYWWRSRLRDRSQGMVRVAVVDGAEAGSARGGFELQLGDITVRVPAGFDDVELRRLLQALQC